MWDYLLELWKGRYRYEFLVTKYIGDVWLEDMLQIEWKGKGYDSGLLQFEQEGYLYVDNISIIHQKKLLSINVKVLSLVKETFRQISEHKGSYVRRVMMLRIEVWQVVINAIRAAVSK